MEREKYLVSIKDHYEKIWGQDHTTHIINEESIRKMPEGFCILKFPPNGKRKMWTFATCGMALYESKYPLELHIFSLVDSPKLVELLTMAAYFHHTGEPLWYGHTVNFGESWLPNSNCEYGLLSLPYLDGPDLEILKENDYEVRFLWLIPITKKERDYKKENGIEALEQLFESKGFNYLDI